MSLKLIDTHCHLNFKSYKEDFVEVAKEAYDKNVKAIIIPGAESITSSWTIEVCKKINQEMNRDFAFGALGIHPHHLDSASEFGNIEKLSGDSSIVAIGECGLDFHTDKDKKTKSQQIDLFCKHIELAKKINLPIIIHNREADEEIYEVLQQFNALPKMVFHCFSTDWDFAQKILELGSYISFTGNITYGNKKLKKVIERTPLERIMIETDGPYIIPEPERSQDFKRNRPYLVLRVLEKIALIKESPAEEVSDEIFKNSKDFFNLDF